jgi:CHASE2 domain-containing sensor protein
MTQILHLLRLFLCHSSGDKAAVRDLYKRLRADGFDPWLDEENLLPGQNWQREITAAVRKSDIVLVCLSRDSINKKGFVQREIKYALDVAEEQPDGSIFIIPLKLEECDIPERLSHLQWVNFFEDGSYEKLLTSLREKSGGPHVGGGAGDLPAQPAHKGRYSGKEILRDLFKGLLFIACVLAIKIAVEQTRLGKQLSLMIYDFLSLSLSADNVPVTVVDISDLEPENFDVGGRAGRATPREALREIIQAISENNPKAIGVAIDFSPDANGYIHPRDPEFFEFCLDLQRKSGVPVFLGIYRNRSEPAENWLGDKKYQMLAANLLIPNDSRRMLSEIQVAGERTPGRLAEASKPGRAMSVALADSYGQESGGPSIWLQQLRESVIDRLSSAGFIEKTFEKRLGPGLTVTEFLVDFSQLDYIEAGTIRTINPEVLRDQIHRRRFAGKVVLIGDATLGKATDLFVVPGRDRPYPGIFLHACAAYTLIEAPLYEVTGRGRLGIDIFFSLAILSAVILIRLYYKNRTAGKGTPHRLQGIFTLLIVIAAMIGAVVFVRATRVMWDDFLLAPVVIVFHPSLERRLGNFWEWLRKQAATRLIIKRNGGSR